MNSRIVVITGASSGIGAALAKAVFARKDRPVLVARRVAKLEALSAECGNASVIPADVTLRAQVDKVVAQTLAKHGRIDVWVNNAGRGITRRPSQLTDSDFDEMMSVNVKSALYGMQAVLPHFQERGRGHLINVSSMLSRVPFAPMRAAYSAAKHALNALTANFRVEVQSTHPDIDVSLFLPGAVATDFGLQALHGGIDSRALPQAQTAEEVAELLVQLIENPKAELYSRPTFQQQVVDYFAAPDMRQLERRPPFTMPAKGT